MRILPLTLLCCFPLYASTVTVNLLSVDNTVSTSYYSSGSFGHQFQVQPFDVSLGTLESILVRYTMRPEIDVHFNTVGETQFPVNLGYTCTVGGSINGQNIPGSTATFAASTYQQIRWDTWACPDVIGQVYLPVTALSSLDMEVNFSVYDKIGYSAVYSTQRIFSASIDYDYTPVPEPHLVIASMLLTALILLGSSRYLQS